MGKIRDNIKRGLSPFKHNALKPVATELREIRYSRLGELPL